ncbi:M1 family metallopeptidase [Streptomyces sp. SCSIO 30461]|uniref:M1 family metallopeptidase n=1 Tax=Streptomyces sp. SCSIO 30461 TaxID=3118085 RepID=UPI0030D13FE0
MAPAVALIAVGGTACTVPESLGAGVKGTPGAAGLHDPYFPKLGNGGYDVSHYALTLDYDPKTRKLSGTATVTARATQDLSAFNLDLHGMTVHSATVGKDPAAVNRAGHELTLRPRDEIPKGSTFRAVVRYSGIPSAITDAAGAQEGWLKTADGAVALGQPTGSMTWFPGNHHPRDKATYETAITVPKGLTAVSNGELRSQRPTSDGKRTTFVWRSAEPVASHAATVGIGSYTTSSYRPEGGGVPVYTAVDKTVAPRTAKLLARIPELTDWAVDNFGPYPFTSTGAIVERSGDIGYALETQSRATFPEASFDAETLVHEIAHQWFGDSVTPETWQDVWLSEGFATYAEWLYLEDFEGIPASESFQEAYDTESNWDFPPAAQPDAEHFLGAPVYDRGAMVLYKVREAVGDDAFHEIVRGWAEKHRHGNASTDDFTAYVEGESGKDLTELWDIWLYGDAKPDQP